MKDDQNRPSRIRKTNAIISPLKMREIDRISLERLRGEKLRAFDSGSHSAAPSVAPMSSVATWMEWQRKS